MTEILLNAWLSNREDSNAIADSSTVSANLSLSGRFKSKQYPNKSDQKSTENTGNDD
jgi:hypothetical protein